MIKTAALSMVLACVTISCGGDVGGTSNDSEVITTVVLHFVPTNGAEITAAFNDGDGDGGEAPTIDPVHLVAGTYALTVQFQNRLSTPVEEITDEVRDEQDVHLLLFTGSAVVGPATANTSGPLTQRYADLDGNGLPVGLANTVVASAGSGQLTVTLRHMPPELPPVKSSTTVMEVQASGIDAIGGSTDAQVDFAVTVQGLPPG